MPAKLKVAEHGTAKIKPRGGRVYLQVELLLSASLRANLLKQLKKYEHMPKSAKLTMGLSRA